MLLPILKRCGRFLRCERAVSALEYAILAGVVMAAVGTAIVAFSDNVADAIAALGGKIETEANTLGVDVDETAGDT